MSLADAVRVRLVVPHWIRVFGNRFTQLVIVLDSTPPSGRIAALHSGSGDRRALRVALDEVLALDARVTVVDLPPASELGWLSAQWFKSGHPVRCQAGTPILAFLFAFSQASEPIVLRADCDMLFWENGWLDETIGWVRDESLDIAQPPPNGDALVSTRALLLNAPALGQRLPISAHRLDPLRSLHRRLHRRPTWLALEQMLQLEVAAGRISHRVAREGGLAIHVPRQEDMELVARRHLDTRIERGDIPQRQLGLPDLVASAW